MQPTHYISMTEEIKKLYSEGVKQIRIASMLGVSRQYVHQVVKSYKSLGITALKRANNPTSVGRMNEGKIRYSDYIGHEIGQGKRFSKGNILYGDIFPLERRYMICIPNMYDTCYDNQYFWHKMPNSVFDHKEYPICPQCKGRFVPIKEGDSKCFKCNFIS
jgi:hypothetical protein